jgi:hypothetical protein
VIVYADVLLLSDVLFRLIDHPLRVALGPAGEGNRASRATALAGEHGLVKGSEAGDVQCPTTSPSRRRRSGVV